MTIWPLLHIDMPPIIPGNVENSVIRSETWQKVQRDGIISFLSKPSLNAKQFNISELEYDYLKTFSYISPHQIIPQPAFLLPPQNGLATPI